MLTNFEDVYKNVFKYTSLDFGDEQQKAVSPALKPILEKFYQEITQKPPDLGKLKSSLYDIFLFLSSVAGRTNANCWIVDMFLSDGADEWRPDISHLPQEFQDVLSETLFLHGAVSQPEYHTSPETFIEMIEKIKI